MGSLLPIPRNQYTDGNGAPLVAGSVAFCQPGTSGTVFLPVYADEAQTTQLTNPVPLDAAGIPFSGGSQVSVWGTGKYETFVRDSQRNLIYSALIDTPAITAGSTIPGPLTISGSLTVNGDITTPSGTITGNQIDGTNGAFTNNLVAKTVFPGFRAGSGSTDANGHLAVTFAPQFNSCQAVVANVSTTTTNTNLISIGTITNTGVTINCNTPAGAAAPSVGINWIAVGT